MMRREISAPALFGHPTGARQDKLKTRATMTVRSHIVRPAAGVVSSLLLALMATAAVAQDEEESGWSGTTSLGYAATTGNAETSSLTAGFNVGLLAGRWRHEFTANAFRATGDTNSGESSTTGERYNLAYQGNWELSERSYLFGRVNFDRDRFAGIRRQFSQTVGYGNKLIVLDRHNLEAEIGLGAKQLRRDDDTELSEGIARAGVRYAWTISDNSEFNQRLFVEAGQQNVFTESISELKARLVGNIAMALSYTIRNNTDVGPDSLNTDTFTAVTLQYDF
jgi:putative salt-induced outer membrane protein